MNITKFFTEDKFGLLVDLHSMADQSMHSSEIGNLNCQVFVISDTQLNIVRRQLNSVQF